MLKEVQLTCASCVEISVGTGGIRPHSSLRLQGALPDPNPDGSNEKQYRCIDCSTIWLLRTDKWGTNCGFRLLP